MACWEEEIFGPVLSIMKVFFYSTFNLASCYAMILWIVELDGHPGHNKGQDLSTAHIS